MRISDWSSDVCSSDLLSLSYSPGVAAPVRAIAADPAASLVYTNRANLVAVVTNGTAILGLGNLGPYRSEEHTSELQSLMRSSYAVFCLKKNNRILLLQE